MKRISILTLFGILLVTNLFFTKEVSAEMVHKEEDSFEYYEELDFTEISLSGFHIASEDTTPPTFDTIADQTIEAGVLDIDWTTLIENVSDNSDGSLTKVEVTDNVDYDTPGTYTVTVKVVDESLNETSQTFNVTVEDTTAPTFDPIEGQTIIEDVNDDIDWRFLVENAIDNSDGQLYIFEVVDNVNYNNPGIYDVSIALFDESYNCFSRTFNVTVEDITPPTFDVIEDQIIIEDENTDINWTTLITNESDNSDGTLTKAEVEDNVDYDTPGTYTVTVKVVDESYNESYQTFNVTVEDTTPPTFDLIADQTIEAGILDIDWTTVIVNESDNSDGTLTLIEVTDNVDYNTPGTYTVTVKVIDESNNETTQTFNVIVEDTTAPTFDIIEDQIIEAGVSDIDWSTFITNASDNSDETLTKVEVEDNVDYDTIGIYTVTVKVVDESLNETTQTFNVTVEDTTSPTFDLIVNQTIEAGVLDIDWTTLIENESDNSDGILTKIEVVDTVDYNTTGMYIVIVIVVDESNNETSRIFLVTVEDTTAPTFDPIIDQTIEAGVSDINWTTLIENESDNSDGILTKDEVIDTVDYDTPGTYTVTLKVVDQSSNQTTQTFNVTVEDTTGPTFDHIANQIIEAGISDIDWTICITNESDNADGTLTFIEVTDNVDYDTLGIYTVTIKVVDESLNETTQTFNVTVEDTTGPTFDTIIDQTIEAGMSDIDWITLIENPSDNADGTLIKVEVEDNVDYDTLGTYTVTVKVVDESNNETFQTFNVTVEDTTIPSFDLLADQTIEAGMSDIDWTTYITNASDNADGSLIFIEVIDNVDYDTLGIYTVTVKVVDVSHNETTQTFNVTVEDTTGPTFDTIIDQTIEAGISDIDWITLIENPSDNADGTLIKVEVEDNVDYDTLGTYTVTVKVVDESLNETTQTFNVTVEDTTIPKFDPIANQTIEAGVIDIDWTTLIENESDNADGTLTKVEVTDNIDYDTPGTYTVTVKVVDESNNETLQTFSVTVEDTTPPSFDSIVDQTIEAGVLNIDWTTLITESDNTDGILTLIEVTDNVDYDTPGTYTVTVKVVDESNNETTQTFNVTVEDTTPPTFDSIVDQIIEAGVSDIDWTIYITNESDNADGTLTFIEVTDNVDYDTPGTYTVTVKVIDESLNETFQTFNATVEDTTAPTFDPIIDQTIEAGISDIDWTILMENASDNSDGTLTKVEVTDNVDYDTLGTYPVTVTLVDKSLNETTQTFNVTVEDTTAPTFDIIDGQTIEAGISDIDWTTLITESDNSDGTLSKIEVEDNVDYDTPGTYTVTVKVVDESLNETSQIFNVTVEDTTAPTFDTIEDQTIIEDVNTDINWTTLIINESDNSDGILTKVEVTDNVDYNTPGTYTVTVKVVDEFNNETLQTFSVTVEDTTPPTCDTIADQIIEAGVLDIDWTTFITNASDNSDGTLSKIEVEDNVDYDTPGIYTVTVKVVDESLNETTKTFDVTIVDTTAPTFDIIEDQIIEAGVSDIDWSTFITNATDNSDETLTKVEVIDNVDYDTPGTYTAKVKVVDKSLNETWQIFDVTVEDTTAPLFDMIANQTIEAGVTDIDWTTLIENESDNSDGTLIKVEVTDNVDYDTLGIYAVTVKVVDESNNETLQTFNVTVEDTTVPTFDTIVAQTIEAGVLDIDWTTLIANESDNSDGILTKIEVTDNVDYNTPGTYTVTVKVVDQSNNETSQTFNVTVEDTTAPSFDIIEEQTIIEDENINIDWTTLIENASDNSDGILTKIEVTDNVDYNTPGTYTVTVKVVDESNNETTQTFNVTVEDTTLPSFDVIADQTIEAGVLNIDWTTFIINESDNSDGTLTKVEVTDNVDYDTLGTYTVTVKVVDQSSNEIFQTFNVTVEDTTAPTFDLIADQTIEAGILDIDWTTYITNESDNSDGILTKVEVTDNVDYDTPGTYTVTVKVVDESNNETLQTFNVTVEDTTAPTFDPIVDQTIEAGISDIDWTTFIENESDNSDGTLTKVEVTDNVDYDTPGTYTVTVKVVDESLNETFQTINVTVEDTIAPIFDIIEGQTIVEDEYDDIDWRYLVENALDNSDGQLYIYEVVDNVNYNNPGIYDVSIALFDESYNYFSQTFNVTVEDITAPTFDTIEDQIIIEDVNTDIDWTTFITNESDNSDGTLTKVEVTDNVDYDTPGTYTVTVKVVDESNNETSQTFNVTVEDTTIPTFDTIDDQTIEAGISDIDWTTFITNASDNSDGSLTKVEVEDNVDYNTPGTYTVTVKVVDESNNETSQTFNVTVEDTTVPTFDTIDDQTIEAGILDIDWITVIENASDNSDGTLIKVEVIDNVDYNTPGTYTVTVNVVDESNNETTQTFNVTVEDTTVPTFDTIADQIIEAGASDIDWATFISNESDNSDGILTKIEVTDNIDYDTPGTYIVIVKVVDESNNETSQTYNVTVEDTTSPTFDTIADQIIEASVSDIDWTTLIENASDNSDGTLTLIKVIDNVDYDTPGTYTVTVKVVDESNNETLQTFNVTVEDTTAPTFDTIADQTIEAGASDIDWTTFIINELDNSDGTLTKVEVIDNVDYDTPGTYTVTVKVVDESNNETSQIFNVTVEDTTAPTFDIIDEQTIIEDENINIDWTTLIENTLDNSDGILTKVEVTDNVDYDTPGTYTVTVKVVDESNNETTQTFNVIVKDTTAPTFNIIDDQIIEAGISDIDWTTAIENASDNANGNLTKVEVTDNVDYDTPGIYTVTVKVVDESNNETSKTFNVTVEDTTAPTFDIIEEQTIIEDENVDIDWRLLIENVLDNSDGQLFIFEVVDNVDYNTPGTYTVTVKVVDESNNETLQTFNVTVEDITAPTFDIIEEQTIIEDEYDDIDWRFLVKNALDNSGGQLFIFEVVDNVDYNNPGIYDVSIALFDESYNCFSQTFNVTVEDITPPTFDTIANQIIEAGVSDIDWTTLIENASDNSGGTLTLIEVTDNVDYNTPGTYTVTVKVVDESNNETTQTFNVTVEDTTAPTFNMIDTQTIEAGVSDIDWTTLIDNESDNSDGTLTLIEVTDNVDYDTPGTYTVTVKVVDESNNETTQTFNVTVEDTTIPTFDTIEDQTIEAGVSDIDWTTLIENASDNSDGTLTLIEVTDNVEYDTPGTYTVTVKVVDESNNETTQTFIVTVEDITPPTFDTIADQIIEAGVSDIDWTTLIENASDNSGGTLTLIEVTDNVDYNTLGTYTVTVKVVDETNNETSQTFNVTVEDTTKPRFDTITDQTIEAGVSDIDWTTLIVNASDNSDGTLTLIEVTDNVDYDTPGIYTVTVKVVDESNNETTQTFIVTVEDTIIPTFDPIADQIIEAGVSDIDWTTLIDNESDNSDGTLTLVEITDNVDYDTPGTYTVTVKVIDESNNETSQTFNVTVEDTTVPTFDTIENQTIEAGVSDIDWTTLIENASDNSDGTLTLIEVTDNVDYDTPGTYTVTVKVVDESNNETSQTFNVTVEDTTIPTFDTITDQIIEAGVSDIDWITLIENASDNSDGTLTLIEVTDNVDYDTPGIYTATVKVVDESNNETSQTFIVTVEDTTKPTFDTIEDQTIEAGVSDIDWTTLIENESDNSDGTLTLIEVTDNVDYNTLGTYTVTVKVVDESNNETTQTFNVTVEDTTIPTFDPIADQIIEAGVSDIDWITLIGNESDNSDGTLTLIEVTDNVDYDTPGTYTVTVKVVDESNNETIQTFNVTVEDTTIPTFDTITDQIIEAGVSDIDWTTLIENASDNSDGTLTLIEVTDNVDYDTPGTFTVTVKVVDESNNETTQTFNVTVEDTTAPTFDLITDQIIEAGVSDIDWTTLIENASDNSDGTLTLIEVIDNVDYDTPGTYTVTVKVVDESNNETTQTFNVTIEDTIIPTFDPIANQIIEAGASDIDWATLIENASDNSDGTLTLIEVTDNVDYDTPGTFTVTVKVVDESNNEIIQTFNVTVEDTTAPTFDLITDQIIEASISDIEWTTLIGNASDNSDGTLTLIEVTDNVDYNTPGTYSVTVKVVDESNNETTQTFNVTVEDTTAPTFDLITDQIIEAGVSDIDWTTLIENASDNSDGTFINIEVEDNVDYDTPGTFTVTVKVVDESNNEIIQTFNVTVEDTTAPTFDLITDQIIESGVSDIDWITLIGNESDNSDGTLTLIEVTDNVDYDTPGTYTVTVKVVDESNNETIQTFNVTVEDTTAPTFDLITDQIIEAGISDIDWITLIENASDNSDGTLINIEVEDNVDYDTPGTFTVTVKVVDESNNETTQTFNVTVEDTTIPTFDPIADQIIEAGVSDIEWTTLIENASDNSDGTLINIEIEDNVDYDTPGTYTVTVKVVDESNNETTQTFNVTVEDTTIPTFDPIADQIIEAGVSDIEWTTLIENASDNSDGTLINIEIEDNVDYDTPGTYTVTVKVVDESNNETTQTFNVTVEDTTIPTFDPIANQIIEAGASDIDWATLITNQSDNSDGTLTLIEVTDNVDYDTPGTYTVTVKVVDESFNETSQTFSVTVEDTTKPTFDTITDQIIESGVSDIDWITLIGNESDNSDGTLTLIEVTDNVDYDTPGTYTVTVKVVDESFNETSQTFSVIVEDTTKPTFDTIEDQTTEAGVSDIDWTTVIVNESDNSDGTLTFIEVTDNVDYNTPGTYTVTVKIVDESNNETIQIFNVTVEDTTAPIITLNPGRDTIYVNETYTDYDVSINDYSNTTTIIEGTVDCTTAGVYELTYRVTDSYGNESIIKRYVNVLEKKPTVVFELESALTTIPLGKEFVDGECNVYVDEIKQSCIVLENNVDINTTGIYTITYGIEVDGVNYTYMRYIFVYEVGNNLILYYRKEEESDIL